MNLKLDNSELSTKVIEFNFKLTFNSTSAFETGRILIHTCYNTVVEGAGGVGEEEEKVECWKSLEAPFKLV